MSVSNTTSNTTPLPVSADATDAAPLQISDEAREAARREDCSQACRDAKIKLDHESGYHVQLAINSATEKLQRENEHLKKALALKGVKMTDQQLQLALAKILPEQLVWNERSKATIWVYPQKHIPGGNSHTVLETEWLHVCWLVEESLTCDEYQSYVKNLTDFRLSQFKQQEAYISASWQQRAEALCKVKGITP